MRFHLVTTTILRLVVVAITQMHASDKLHRTTHAHTHQCMSTEASEQLCVLYKSQRPGYDTASLLCDMSWETG